MNTNKIYYRCEECGNMINFIENTGIEIKCCGKEMTSLPLNTIDSSSEKHVPVLSFSKTKPNELLVKIGAVEHPMTPEHHITWISVEQGSRLSQRKLKITDNPESDFYAEQNQPAIAYAYCNLHGLWAAELPAETNSQDIICSAEFSEGCK